LDSNRPHKTNNGGGGSAKQKEKHPLCLTVLLMSFKRLSN
jgi:hypothetical protein